MPAHYAFYYAGIFDRCLCMGLCYVHMQNKPTNDHDQVNYFVRFLCLLTVKRWPWFFHMTQSSTASSDTVFVIFL